MEYAFDVFISYKSEERAEAIHVRNVLKANGLSCWMDQDQIKVGSDYKKDITTIMPQCRSLLLLMSYISQASKEVVFEYQLARKNNIAVFPIKIEDCKLTDYFDEELRHTQIAKDYWKSSHDKQKILNSIRDTIYALKGEPVRTSEDFLNMRIKNYQKYIKKEYILLKKGWSSVIKKSVERCNFMTPEPHFIKAIMTEAVREYQDLVDIYIEDIVLETERTKYFEDFMEFILKQDLITEIWWPYEHFVDAVLQQLTYLKDHGAPNSDAFLLRIYKDYLITLNTDTFSHPVVKLCNRLRLKDIVKYETILSKIQYENNPAFDGGTSLAAYISPRYIGEEYLNINGNVIIDNQRSIFDVKEIGVPKWTDFFRRFTCDMLIKELIEKPGADTLINFFIDNTFFVIEFDQKNETRKGNLNYMYLYLVNKLIEARHPEYVKILLRNLGRFDWNLFMCDTEFEIQQLKDLYMRCMYENGYSRELSLQLWREA